MKTHDGKTVSSSSLNPSFGVIWQPHEHWSFSASHNYASRSPRLYDALQTHGKRGIISIADGTKAERARNTEIGFNYNDGTFAANGSYFWQTSKTRLPIRKTATTLSPSVKPSMPATSKTTVTNWARPTAPAA